MYVGGADADYSTIQEAVNAAKNNATIIVKHGVYNELIDINKTITLIGEDKNTTIINFNPTYPISQVPILNIHADNCSIENLQITLGNTSVIAKGILINTKNNTIKNTIITNLANGIELAAYSESNIIIHNEIKNNLIGIDATSSSRNTIAHNMFSNNTQYHIYLSTSSDRNNVSFNILDTSAYGLRIKGSQDNLVFTNCIKNNNRGLYCCCGARSNHFYHNALLNNSINAEENAGLLNIWYVYPNGTGNYWDDYNGTDDNHDGIGDTPYTIAVSKNQDLHPLMTPPVDIPCNQ
jgi:parallel beta-helix repeat protein